MSSSTATQSLSRVKPGLAEELVRIFMVLSSYPASGLRHAPIARCEQIGCRHAMIMPQVLSARPGAPSRRQQGFESLPDATSFWEVQRRNGFQGDPGSQIAQGTFESPSLIAAPAARSSAAPGGRGAVSSWAADYARWVTCRAQPS